MKQTALILVAVLILLILATLGGAFYIVTETEQVVITQFGRPVGQAVLTPGLKIKLPFPDRETF